MKNQMIRGIKKIMAVSIAISMLCGVGYATTLKSEAHTNADIVRYEPFEGYTDYIEREAPEYKTEGNGYVFGGWYYQDDQGAYQPLAKAEDLPEGKKALAKWVPSSVLSVKVQNKAGTNEQTDSTVLRAISAIDSLNYKQVGFDTKVIILKEDGCFQEQRHVIDATTTKAYSKFKVYESTDTEEVAEEYGPKELFGEAAHRFTTALIAKVQRNSFQKIVCITPYWITPDGVKVTGLTRYVHVEDGYAHGEKGEYRYVNVPVNVRKFADVAAGVVTMKVPEGCQFLGIEGGRLFEEMDATGASDQVKIVGNVSNIRQNKSANDIFANVRFKVASSEANKYALTGYSFNITSVDFADKDEKAFTDTTYPVWNINF